MAEPPTVSPAVCQRVVGAGARPGGYKKFGAVLGVPEWDCTVIFCGTRRGIVRILSPQVFILKPYYELNHITTGTGKCN
jgi:hypothetical protein